MQEQKERKNSWWQVIGWVIVIGLAVNFVLGSLDNSERIYELEERVDCLQNYIEYELEDDLSYEGFSSGLHPPCY